MILLMLYQYIILSYGLTLGRLGAPTVEPSPTPESGDLQKPTVTIPDPFPHDNRVRSTLGYVNRFHANILLFGAPRHQKLRPQPRPLNML